MARKSRLVSLPLALALLGLVSCSDFSAETFQSYSPASLALANMDIEGELSPLDHSFRVSDVTADVFCGPIREGLEAIGEGWDYSLARVVSLGNLWLATTGTGIGLDSAEVRIATPTLFLSDSDAMEQYLGIGKGNQTIESLNSFRAVESALGAGEDSDGNRIDYVVLPEPYLTIALKDTTAVTYGKAKRLTSVYKEATAQGKSYYQYGVFLKKGMKTKTAQKLMTQIDENLDDISKDVAYQTLIYLIQLGDETSLDYFDMTGSTLREVQQNQDEAGNVVNVNRLCFASNQPTVSELEDAFGSAIGEDSLFDGAFLEK